MAGTTKIEWTTYSWNPLRGCSRVSEGCRNCYAERQAARFSGPGQLYEGLVTITNGHPQWTGKVVLVEKDLAAPLRWRKPRKIFVNSMSDLFHEAVPDEWIDRIFLMMMLCQRHTFQILTKRAQRMCDYCASEATKERMFILASALANLPGVAFHAQGYADGLPGIRLPNVWLGVSVEDQATADERIPLLLQTPAAVRWVSYEPALGPVTFRWAPWQEFSKVPGGITNELDGLRKLDWIVCGGESGPGARPFDIQWARNVVAQGRAAGVPVFVKQLGANVHSRNDTGFEGDTPHSWPMDTRTGESEAYQGASLRVYLRNRKGGDPAEWLEDLRVREFPSARTSENEVPRKERP